MGKISEIMKSSQKGYIDDPREVKRITDRMMETKMNVFLENLMWPKHAKEVLGGLLSSRGINDCFAGELSFGEVIALVGSINTGSPDTVEGWGCSMEDFKRFQTIKLREMIHDTGRNNLLVRQFLGLNVMALLKYLEDRHYDRKVYEIGIELQYLDNISIPGRSDNEKNHMQLSVGELFEATRRTLTTPWIPWNGIYAYERKILKAEETEGLILIDALFYGYRERMHLEDIHHRYDELSDKREGNDYMKANCEMEEKYDGKNN